MSESPDLEREFMWAVQALALPAREQEVLFPSFVELGDELADDYEQAHRAFMAAATTHLSPEQHEAIAALDEHIAGMSGPENCELWRMESICTSEEWARMRELAKAVLRQMGWSLEAPPVRGTVIFVNIADIARELVALLAAIRPHVPALPLDSIEDLVRHHELGVALENLCDNLFEEGVELPGALKQELVKICRLFGLDQTYWAWLNRAEED
jgi:hypothetical protein